ncbi:hypothetical protein DFA_03720 [Cavenderia fasciculata]|uniref:Uncharacterized protein n=1 Tax=Cavenderia fasciculata TaxID=261658 RepID=F4Q082_CACFS|nr:uncharacterized protein DFA_03720 [Cavenderia fasciculata]EGG18233.1 hypothetical protein DFA_03720 [Cavenderia fasciculata]|eukprot:XP_004357056.1 hypothetical protein DFA_03720 [Cavenderia fasciculata]
MKLLLLLSIIFLFTTIIIASINHDPNNEKNPSFYLIEKDERKCPKPKCGGYFISMLNEMGGEKTYVSELSTDPKLNGPMEIAEGRQMIGYGYTNRPSSRHYMEMVVIKIFISIQITISKNPHAQYYMIDSTKCLKPPCPMVTHLLNQGTDSHIKSIKNPFMSIPNIDEEWMTSRLYGMDDLHSIVQMTENDKKYTMTGMFIQVPDPIIPCPKVQDKCHGKEINVYSLDSNRCPVWMHCTMPTNCHVPMPKCQDGWDLHSFPSHPNGCLKYYCNPDFITPSPKIKSN